MCAIILYLPRECATPTRPGGCRVPSRRAPDQGRHAGRPLHWTRRRNPYPAGRSERTMATLLVKNATLLVTMDDEDHHWAGGGIYVVDNRIEAVGPAADLPETAARVIDAAGMIILPG